MAALSDTESWFQRLSLRVQKIDSLLCVGLDPHVKELPEPTVAAAVAFCERLITATLPYAAAYKPNAAFFERFGAEGVAALAQVIASIPDDVPVLLDAKRGDIGSTSEAYAVACYEAMGASAVTLSPYMGSDSLNPFTAADPSKGAFVLCKTSNPSSNEVQTLKTSSGLMVYEEVAKITEETWNVNGNVGLVVGATDITAITNVRKSAPSVWILAPGVGAQGGELGPACEAGLMVESVGGTELATGILFPVSRGISKAEDPAAAAVALRDAMNECRASWMAKKGAGGAGGAAAAASEESLEPYQKDFLDFAVSKEVLRFGSFTLKSGRQSPYFFNAGLFNTGATVAALGRFYAHSIVANKLEFDVIFGPAYKGIPLATAVGIALSTEYGLDYGITYNRKEAKDHGEGGLLVGASLDGKRVLLVDDVITAGTAIREAVGIVKANGGTPSAVAIGLDRQEKVTEESTESAVQSVMSALQIPVCSIVSLKELSAYIADGAGVDEETAAAVATYRATYGVC